MSNLVKSIVQWTFYLKKKKTIILNYSEDPEKFCNKNNTNPGIYIMYYIYIMVLTLVIY